MQPRSQRTKVRSRAAIALGAAVMLAVPVASAGALSPTQGLPGEELQVTNHSFEDPVLDGDIPGWEMRFGAAGDGEGTVVDDVAYDGEHSFWMDSPEDDVAYGLLGDPIDITGGEEYEASYHVWVEYGTPSMYLYFYDADGEQVAQSSDHFRDLPAEEWVRVSLSGTAPEEAVSAGILIYSLQNSVSSFYADQVELTHQAPLDITDHGVAMHTPNVRMADATVLDDGTPVGFLFNDGNPVSLSMVHLGTGEALDRHEFPDHAMASAIAIDESDDMVYLSVRSPNDGTLWSYDPHTGDLVELATRVVDEEMLRSLLVRDGTLYGSTYPDAKVYSYDLDSGDIHDYGTVDEQSSYAWGFEEVGGNLWVGTGTNPTLNEVDVDTGEISRLDVPADITDNADFINRMVRHEDLVFVGYSPGGDSSMAVYDLGAGEWCCTDVDSLGTWTEDNHDGAFYYMDGSEVRGFDIDSRSDFSIGWGESELSGELTDTRSLHLLELDMPDYPGTSLLGIREDGAVWVFNLEDQHGEVIESDIQGAPATIQSMDIGPDGNPYTGAYLSSGVMARVDHDSGDLEPLNGPGQADALATVGDSLVVGAYPGASYYTGDAFSEWDWGTNPAHLFTVGRTAGQDRTSALIAAGDLAAAGTVPNYGELGGALVLFDPDGGEQQIHEDVVPDHSVTALAHRDGLVYGGTGVHGGLDSDPADGPAELFVWDVEAQELLTSTPVDGAEYLHSLAFDADGQLWAMADTGALLEYDPHEHEFVRSVATGLSGSNIWGRISEMNLHPGNTMMYGNAGGRLYTFDPADGEFRTFGPTGIRYSAITEDGTLYFTDQTNVYSMVIDGAEPICDEAISGTRDGGLVVDSGTVCLEDATINGGMQVTAEAAVIMSDSTVRGPVEVSGADQVQVVDSDLRGPVTIQDVAGGVRISDNEIRGPVELTGGEHPEPAVISGNLIRGPLACQDNAAVPIDGGTVNDINGPTTGQCADF